MYMKNLIGEEILNEKFAKKFPFRIIVWYKAHELHLSAVTLVSKLVNLNIINSLATLDV